MQSREARQPFIYVATGMTGVGKSYQTENEIRLYVHASMQTGREPRKALIFDTNDEYQQYKTVAYDVTQESPSIAGKYLAMLQQPEIRRIAPFAKDKNGARIMTFNEKERTIVNIMSNFRDGLVLLEDPNTYMIGAKSVDTISMLCANRHKGIDLIMHFQSLSALDPRMWQNTTIVRMHYQSDDIVRYRGRIPNFELMKIAQNIVSSEYLSENKRFFVYVNIRSQKIIGCTIDQYKAGVQRYIEDYEPTNGLVTKPYIYL